MITVPWRSRVAGICTTDAADHVRGLSGSVAFVCGWSGWISCSPFCKWKKKWINKFRWLMFFRVQWLVPSSFIYLKTILITLVDFHNVKHILLLQQHLCQRWHCVPVVHEHLHVLNVVFVVLHVPLISLVDWLMHLVL